MKTLTELSGSVIRAAAAAVAEAKRSLPSDEKSAPPAMTDAPPATDAPPQDAAAAGGEATGEAAAPGEAPATADAPAAATPDGAPGNGGAASEVIDAALAKATGLSGDRLTMLRGAVEAAGRRTEDVRLVRVFAAEEQVPGATKVGAFQYVVDLFPASMRQNTAPREDRGRRGGGRGGGGGGGGGRGAKAGATGGFSMDSLRDDRKNERGGRGPGGAGRRPGGGGPRGGGRPGGPPGGAPKK